MEQRKTRNQVEPGERHADAFDEPRADAIANRIKMLLLKGHLVAAQNALRMVVEEYQDERADRQQQRNNLWATPVSAVLNDMRVVNKLEEYGVRTLASLVACTRQRLLDLPNLGPSKVDYVEHVLGLMGMELAGARPGEGTDGDC